MPRRDTDDDFEDDEYLPRRHRDAGESGAGLWTGLGVAGVVVVVGMLVLFVSRGREAHRAQAEAAFARAEAERMRAVPGPNAFSTTTENAWSRMIGVWERRPRGGDDTSYPYRFEFRDDLTATTARLGPGGPPVRQESRVEILSDQGDTVRLQLHMGSYDYTFTLRPDGRLELGDEAAGLVFTRAE